MNLQNPSLNPSTEKSTAEYVGLWDIFHSWFWRFYDHLAFLLLINLAWFLTCFGVGWAALHFDMLGSDGKINFGGIYAVYLLECAVSLGWAFLVFKLFNEGRSSLKELWGGIRKYFWKAMGVSALSGSSIGLALINIRFYFHLQSAHRFLDLLMAGFILWILAFLVSASLLQWPILFFQNPPFSRIIYRSCLLVLGNGLISLAGLIFLSACFLLFNIAPFFWYFIGLVFFFSFQCVVLEKHYLRYKITYGDQPLEPFLEVLEGERRRGWREFLRPWENR